MSVFKSVMIVDRISISVMISSALRRSLYKRRAPIAPPVSCIPVVLRRRLRSEPAQNRAELYATQRSRAVCSCALESRIDANKLSRWILVVTGERRAAVESLGKSKPVEAESHSSSAQVLCRVSQRSSSRGSSSTRLAPVLLDAQQICTLSRLSLGRLQQRQRTSKTSQNFLRSPPGEWVQHFIAVLRRIPET